MATRIEHLRLRDLMLLEQVQACGTLRQVAQNLHVTQPAVTQMLRGLEEAFGLPLVERGRRGVQLTPAGQAACERLRCARQEVEQARRAAQDHQRPQLRLGATPIAGLRLLPGGIGRLRTQLPQLRLMLSEAGVGALWKQLSDGSLDALIGRLPTGAYVVAGLRYEALGDERMVMVARRGHPVLRQTGARRSTVRVQVALAACDWVLPPDDSLAMSNFKEWFGQAGLAAPVAAVVSGSFQASLSMVAQSDLLSIVPASAVRAQADALGLTVLRTGWPDPPVHLVFAAREAHWDRPEMQVLRDCLRNSVDTV